MPPSDKYDPLCDVIEDWYEAHKAATRAGNRPPGVQTPPVARHEYLRKAGLFDGERDGRGLYDFFAWVRDPSWPDRHDPDSKPSGAFHARVRAGRFDLLREWVIVFDPRTRHLYSDQDRANVLRSVANAAQRIADE